MSAENVNRERLHNYNEDFEDELDFDADPKNDPTHKLLIKLVREGKIHLIDEEGMGDWTAHAVVKTKDGGYALFHPR